MSLMHFVAAYHSFEVYSNNLEKNGVDAPMLSTVSDMLEDQYKSSLHVISSLDTKIVAMTYSPFFLYIIVHSQNWSTPQCKQLLKIFYNCLLLKTNILSMTKHTGNLKTYSSGERKQIMDPIVSYLSSHATNVPILLSCLESIDLNSFIRTGVMKCIEEKIKPFSNQIHHAILFINNKCVALVTNPQSQQQQLLLYPLDLLCLFIDLKSGSALRNPTIFLQEKLCELFIHSNGNTHLLFVCASQESLDCKSIATEIEKELESSFLSFLKIKAETHITIQHYLHYCPGLVHFIFIDRIRHVMIAPSISDKQLEEPIFEMIQLLMEQHKNSSSHEWIAITTHNAFQYCFQEWMQDENGNTLKMIPSNFKFCRAHFQFYAMYLPIVSTQAMAHYNRILINLLWEDNFK